MFNLFNKPEPASEPNDARQTVSEDILKPDCIVGSLLRTRNFKTGDIWGRVSNVKRGVPVFSPASEIDVQLFSGKDDYIILILDEEL